MGIETGGCAFRLVADLPVGWVGNALATTGRDAALLAMYEAAVDEKAVRGQVPAAIAAPIARDWGCFVYKRLF